MVVSGDNGELVDNGFASVFSVVLGMVSISVFTQVWVIDPWLAVKSHTLPFIGFRKVLDVSVLAMMLQSSGTAFKGWVFLVIYRVISAMLPMNYSLKKTWDISLNQSVADGYGVRVTAAKETMPAMMQFTKCSLKRGLPCACQGSFESTIHRGSRSVGIWRSDH